MYKVGIELEIKPVTGETRRTILEHLNNVGIPIRWEGYTHDIMNRWKAVPDGSLNGGFELVSKPMSGVAEIEREVTNMTNALKGKARIDRQCGHHIHISLLEKYWARRRVNISTENGRRKAIKSKQVKIFCAKLLRNYGHFQKVIDAIVAPSRRVIGSYAFNASIPSEFLTYSDSEIESLNYVELTRHSVINFHSLVKYGTVEFRQFQGTINKTKIMNWMKLTERFCARTSDRKYKNVDARNFPQTIDGMCDFLGFGKYGVRRWARNRAISNGFSDLATESVPEVINSISEPTNPTTGHNSINAINAEVTEAILVLENDYNSYHAIRTWIDRYNNDDLYMSVLKNWIRESLEARNLPTSNEVIMGVILHFQALE